MESWHPALIAPPASSVPRDTSVFVFVNSVCSSVKWACWARSVLGSSQPWNVIELCFSSFVRSLVEAYWSFFILADGSERAFSQWSGLMAGVMKDSSGWVLWAGERPENLSPVQRKAPASALMATRLCPVKVLTWGSDCLLNYWSSPRLWGSRGKGLSCFLHLSPVPSIVPGTY